MKTAEEWVEHLGMGVWASDIIEIQKDAWEAATKAQMERDAHECGDIDHLKLVPFPEAQ